MQDHTNRAAMAAAGLESTQQGDGSGVNDLHQRSDLDAVKATAEEVLYPTGKSNTDQPKAGLLCAADLEPRSITWLWNGWLAVGVLHVIAGAPGTGKTTLAMALAAILSTGGRWPDGTTADQGDVVIWSGEDLIEETLLPRLRAMGADPSRIHFVHDAADAAGRRPFDPSTDLPQLLAAIREKQLEVKLVIIDPIVSAIKGDSHKNTETRRGLQPLVDFAESEGCAILGISHFTKGTAGREVVERVTGSLAFGAVARLVLVAAKMPDDQGGGRIVARAKSNLGADTGGYRYELHETLLDGREEIKTSRVAWGEALEGSARELLAKAEAPVNIKEQTALDEIAEWLQETLQHEPVKVTDLKPSAELAGFAWRTVQRAAKQKLGVVIKRIGFGPGSPYYWSLPSCAPTDAMPAKPEQMAPMGASGAHGTAAIEPKVLPWRTEL